VLDVLIRDKVSKAEEVVHDEDDQALVEHLHFVAIFVLERSLPTNQDNSSNTGHRQDEVLDDEVFLKNEDAYHNQQLLVVIK